MALIHLSHDADDGKRDERRSRWVMQQRALLLGTSHGLVMQSLLSPGCLSWQRTDSVLGTRRMWIHSVARIALPQQHH